MSNADWYRGLAVIGLLLLAAALLYRRDWKILVMHLNIAAILHPFEIVVLILLEAYHYMPGFLPDSRLDNYLGAYVSNSLIIPASAVAISAFSLSRAWILIFAAVFTGIDWYFTTLGIYRHLWWKSVYTGGGLIILYALSRRLWSGLQIKRPPLIFRLAVIYLTYAPIHNLIIFMTNKGGQLFRLQIPWLGDSEKYHQALFFLHLFITAVIITLCIGLKLRLRYRLGGIALLALVNWAIGHYHIFVAHEPYIFAQQLILVPVVAVPILIILFKAAKLDYLFP